MSEPKIREYAEKKAFHTQTLARWLAWEPPDRDALYRLVLALKIGENHLRDLMDWLEEILARDGLEPRRVLGGGAVAEIESDPRLGRADKLKRIKEEIRRQRFPRLAHAEDSIRRRVRDLKLYPAIRLSAPPGLEGGRIRVEFDASSQDELRQLVAKLAEAAECQSMREVFDLLHGVASDPNGTGRRD